MGIRTREGKERRKVKKERGGRVGIRTREGEGEQERGKDR